MSRQLKLPTDSHGSKAQAAKPSKTQLILSVGFFVMLGGFVLWSELNGSGGNSHTARPSEVKLTDLLSIVAGYQNLGATIQSTPTANMVMMNYIGGAIKMNPTKGSYDMLTVADQDEDFYVGIWFHLPIKLSDSSRFSVAEELKKFITSTVISDSATRQAALTFIDEHLKKIGAESFSDRVTFEQNGAKVSILTSQDSADKFLVSVDLNFQK